MLAVRLRPIEMSDLEQIKEWVNDQEVVGKFAGLTKTITAEDEKKYLEKIISSEKDQLYAIETEQGAYIGNIGLHEIDPIDRSARIGMIIGKKQYWGQGCGQDAITALLSLAFQDHDLQKVWCKFLSTNDKMHHIMVDKCGFRIEGALPDEYFREGRYHDMIKASMLKTEYEERRDIKWKEK